jgi:AraC family transcriptional regulator, arabinose operon regulatory protein
VDNTRDPRIARAIETLERRLAERVSVGELAQAANLSESRFAHLFRQQTGMSPGRYLQRLRMERAGVLLGRTSLRISEVMTLVGCTDPSHFSRDFRRYFGAGPREYRRDTARLVKVVTDDASEKRNRPPE